MGQPTAIAVTHTAPVKLAASRDSISPRKGLSIQVASTEPEAVAISWQGKSGLAYTTGYIITPGQGIVIGAGNEMWGSIASSDIWAISSTQAVNVRVQEIE